MFARNVSIHLKSNMLSDYRLAFEKDVLGYSDDGDQYSDVMAIRIPRPCRSLVPS
jgi:hypothetical protein